MKKRFSVICGGSGSSKFASALSEFSEESGDLKFIANVGDNFWHHGLYVCPDIDIIAYSLSNLLDVDKGWGVKGDVHEVRQVLSRISRIPEWFGLGDRDLAVSLKRTELYRKGWSLSSITREICFRLGVKGDLIPATDDPLQTFIRTAEGNLHLQEFWVKNAGKLDVTEVQYQGIEKARPTTRFLEACSEPVIVCPANPVTSILPTLGLRGVKSRLKKTRVVAVSPFVGEKPFSGPAATLLRAGGIETNSRGVAKLYSGFLKALFLDKNEDPSIVQSIREMGIECIITNTRISSESDKAAIAMELVAAL